MIDDILDPSSLYYAESLQLKKGSQNMTPTSLVSEQLTLPLSVETVDAPALEFDQVADIYQDGELEAGDVTPEGDVL